MSNPIIQTNIADILKEIQSDQKEILRKVNHLEVNLETVKGDIKTVQGKIESLDEKLSGKIESLDEKLSGKIESLDEKLSGQIKALDTKVDQLDKRISNSELTNRGVLIGLVVIILGGAAKLFGLMGNP